MSPPDEPPPVELPVDDEPVDDHAANEDPTVAARSADGLSGRRVAMAGVQQIADRLAERALVRAWTSMSLVLNR